ncbi:integrase [Mycobacterium phage Weirdo19]|uniref:Integrase n=1 Tax=Mycobacterium phage Weirdo19 TaxID=2601610 RepID=A0A6M2YSW0_9CAUD|nr:integrase [Mycobacterium phage Weirdo19]QEA10811.1 integrase [Mycobacterium phage Weirdo19]
MSAAAHRRPAGDPAHRPPVSSPPRLLTLKTPCEQTGNVVTPRPRSSESEGTQLVIQKVTGPAPTAAPAAWREPLRRYFEVLAASGYPATTLATRGAHLRRIARELGVSPGAVTGPRLVGFFARQEHWARETRRGYRASCVSFFTWAHREGLIESNPSLDLPSVAAARPAPRPAPDRVYREALLAAPPRVMVMLRLAAEAGLRRAEVARLHTEDLTEGLDGWVLLVHGKGGKVRTVPITDELAALVGAGAAGHTPGAPSTGWLFPGDDNGHLSPRYVGKLCAAAMPAGWTMHKLRHRFATRAFRGTRNLRAVQTLLGHASVATTEIYTAVDDAEVRAAMLAASEPTAERGGRGRRALGVTSAAIAMAALWLGITDAAPQPGSVSDHTPAAPPWSTERPGMWPHPPGGVELAA